MEEIEKHKLHATYKMKKSLMKHAIRDTQNKWQLNELNEKAMQYRLDGFMEQ